jgi:hypothetical protein
MNDLLLLFVGKVFEIGVLLSLSGKKCKRAERIIYKHRRQDFESAGALRNLKRFTSFQSVDDLIREIIFLLKLLLKVQV